MLEKKPTRIADLVDFGAHVVQGRVINRKALATTRAGKPWFSFVLDDDSSDIKVDCFNEAEKFSPQISIGDIIRLENISIVAKNTTDRKFDQSRSDYKISIRNGTIITLIAAANAAPPPDKNKQIESALSTISAISTAQESVRGFSKQETNPLGVDGYQQGGGEQSVTHICTILAGVSAATILHSPPESARQWSRLELQIIDQTGTTKVSLWSDQLEPFLATYDLTQDNVCEHLKGKVILLSRLQVKHSERFGTQCLCSESTRIFLNEDILPLSEKSNVLSEFYKWWASSEAREARTNLSATGPGSQGREDIGGKWKTMPYSNVGDIMTTGIHHILGSLIINRNVEAATYRGCASCKSALRDSPICSKCQETSAGERFYWRIGAQLSDVTSHTRVTIFDPYASALMEMTADEFVEKGDEQKAQLLTKVIEVDAAIKVTSSGADGRDRTNIVGIDLFPNYCNIFDQLVDELLIYRRNLDALK